MFSIKNMVVIVTGGGKGIGRYLAEGMAKNQAFVYCIDTKFPEKVPSTLSNNLVNCKGDVLDRKRIRQIFKYIFNCHKHIDVLINNAGVGFYGKGLFYPEEKWNKTIDVNLTGVYRCTQEAIRFMLKNKNGRIINITSLNAELAFSHNPAYISSKAGLKMLGKSFAKDFGKYGIRVNNLGPGYIKTDLTNENYLNKKIRKSRERRTMLGRWGEKEDLLGPCIFLASDASRYITGQDIYVDGGWLANGLPEND